MRRYVEHTFLKAMEILKECGITDEERCRHGISLFEKAELRLGKGIPYNESACILHMPQKINDKYDFDRVTIQIGWHQDERVWKYTMYHELAHLISIGYLQEKDNLYFYRPWGVCRTIYRIEQGCMVQQVEQMYYESNEALNECLACFLYEMIEGESPLMRFLLKRGEWAGMDRDSMLTQYIKNDTQLMQVI